VVAVSLARLLLLSLQELMLRVLPQLLLQQLVMHQLPLCCQCRLWLLERQLLQLLGLLREAVKVVLPHSRLL